MGEVVGHFVGLAWLDATAARNDDLVAVLLVCLVVAVVISALAIRRLVRRELLQRDAAPDFEIASAPSSAIFDAPTRWLAVRTHNPQLVQDALGVKNPRVCSWSDALATPFEPRLFISPAVRGWVLFMGCDLPDPTDDIDQCFLFLTRLSHKLGEVHFFARNRAVSHHGWARLDGGRVVRAYVWAGETLWKQGTVTEGERDLKVRCLTYIETTDILGLLEREALALNTEKVVRLAAAWSIDPTNVEASALESKGIAGDLLHSKLH